MCEFLHTHTHTHTHTPHTHTHTHTHIYIYIYIYIVYVFILLSIRFYLPRYRAVITDSFCEHNYILDLRSIMLYTSIKHPWEAIWECMVLMSTPNFLLVTYTALLARVNLAEESHAYMRKLTEGLMNWFNGMLVRSVLFYAKRLGNNVLCTFLFKLFVYLFKRFCSQLS